MKISIQTVCVGVALVFSVFFLSGASNVFGADGAGLFELEGNAVQDDTAPPPDDWETLYGGGGAADPSIFEHEGSGVSIFTGGRKDIQNIPEWGYKDGAVPDKDDILDAFAAAYNDNGDLIVYFGADRISNVGDAYMGFWFFKQQVSLDGNGGFIGEHEFGDILVLVNFPQATNAVPLVQVVEWDTSCSKADSNNPMVGQCAAANLRLLAGVSGAGAICDGTGYVGSAGACAITNEEGGPYHLTTSPWPYTSKDGYVDQFPYETFFEGGINLTQLVGGDTCYSSFMAETRSSSSFTASLKDFVLDSFPVCAISVTKDCTSPILSADNNYIIYTIAGAVTNDGSATVYNVSLVDVPAFDSGSLNWYGSTASLAGGASIDYSATITVPLGQNGPSDQVTATAYTLPAGGTALTASATDTCPALQISPELSVTKSCSSIVTTMNTPVQVVAQVNVSGEVCNIGDTPLFNVAVVDNEAGTLLSGQYLVEPDDPANPGDTEGACKTYSGSYIPSEALVFDGSASTTDPSLVYFRDSVTATATDIFGASVTPQYANAKCPLCPECEECP